MRNIALVLDGIVVAIAVWDGESHWNPGEQYTLLDVTDYDVSPGDEYVGTEIELDSGRGGTGHSTPDLEDGEVGPVVESPGIEPLAGLHIFNKIPRVRVPIVEGE